MVTKEQIEQLRTMIDEGQKLLHAAAQFAGENNIPLKFIDPDYEEPEVCECADDEDCDCEEDEDDYYGDHVGMYFGGQTFGLQKGYRSETYRWYNSNC